MASWETPLYERSSPQHVLLLFMIPLNIPLQEVICTHLNFLFFRASFAFPYVLV